MPYVLPLEALDRSQIEVAGGKAANLGETLRAGLPVPPGLCITTDLFVLRQLGLKAAEEEVLERFVPQGPTQRLARAGGTVPARVVPVTILIADIRGFTTLSEPLGPTEARRRDHAQSPRSPSRGRSRSNADNAGVLPAASGAGDGYHPHPLTSTRIVLFGCGHISQFHLRAWQQVPVLAMSNQCIAASGGWTAASRARTWWP